MNNKNFNLNKILLTFFIFIFYIFYLENYDLVLYNISFNLTIITQINKKTTGSSLVDSILLKNEPILESNVSKNESGTEKIDSTLDNLKSNDGNKSIFNSFYNKILTFVNTIKAKFIMFKLVISNNKYYHYLFRLIKFSLWLMLSWFTAIGIIMFKEYNLKYGLDHNIIYNLYEAIKLNMYETHQNTLIYLKEYIESWITLDKKVPKLDRSSPMEISKNSDILEELARKNYRFNIYDNTDNPFYKSPYFYVPVIIIISALATFSYLYWPEYFKHIQPKDINPGDGDLPKDINSSLTSPEISIKDATTPLEGPDAAPWKHSRSATPVDPFSSVPVASSSSLHLENVHNTTSSSISLPSSTESTPVPSKTALPSSESIFYPSKSTWLTDKMYAIKDRFPSLTRRRSSPDLAEYKNFTSPEERHEALFLEYFASPERALLELTDTKYLNTLDPNTFKTVNPQVLEHLYSIEPNYIEQLDPKIIKAIDPGYLQKYYPTTFDKIDKGKSKAIFLFLMPSLLLKNIKINLMILKFYIILKFNEFINKIFIIININKLPKKNITLSLLILICIITTLIIRFDYILNLLNNLPYEIEISIRITSALYSILSIFILMISIKYLITLTKLFINKDKYIYNYVYYLYTFYFIFILLGNTILYIINYNSILSLQIQYLDLIYLFLSFTSLIFSIYYVIFKHITKIDLNKTLSLTGKICLLSILIIYLSLLIGLKSGLLLEYADNYGLFKNLKLYCESTDSTNNINNNLKGKGKITDDSNSRIDLSHASNNPNTANINSIAGNNNANAINSTMSNVNINPSQPSSSSQPNIKSNVNKKEILTTTLIGGKSVLQQTHVKQETTTLYNNTNNSSKHSLNNSTNNSTNSFKLSKWNEAITIFKNIFKSTTSLQDNSTSKQNLIGDKPRFKDKYINDALGMFNQKLNSSNPTTGFNTPLPDSPLIHDIPLNQDSPVIGDNPLIEDKNLNVPVSENKNLNTDKELPNIPKKKFSLFNIRKIRSLPNISRHNSDVLLYSQTVDRVYKEIIKVQTIDIDKNTNNINLPHDIKNLTDFNSFNKFNNKIIKSIKTNLDYVIPNISNEDIDSIGKNFWINYDSKFKKNKCFIFVSIDKISAYSKFDYNAQVIGAKNHYELISYLNVVGNKFHNINEMKETLVSQVKKNSVWDFRTWSNIYAPDLCNKY